MGSSIPPPPPSETETAPPSWRQPRYAIPLGILLVVAVLVVVAVLGGGGDEDSPRVAQDDSGEEGDAVKTVEYLTSRA